MMNLPPPSSTSDAAILRSDQRLSAIPRTERGLSVTFGVVLFNNPPVELKHFANALRRARARFVESEAAQSRAAPAFSLRLHNNGGDPIDRQMFGNVAQSTDSPTNIGFGPAHNRLMDAAFAEGADFYLALNPDGMLHPDALTELIAVARRTEGRAVVEAAQFPEELPKAFDPLTLDTAWASGCCLLIPSAIHAAIGGFDENLFLYCEDVDLSWRAREAGFSVRHAPRALFFHIWNRNGVNPVTRQIHLESARYLSRKWRNETFQRDMEREIVAQGWELRPLPEAIPSLQDGRVADFRHGLSFTRGRWDGPGPIPSHVVTAHPDIDNTIDVIVRFHDPSQVQRLSRCLFSLYATRHQPIQVLLMLQNLDDAGVAAVTSCVDAFDWSPPRKRPLVTNVALPPTGDHRARLWNAGIDIGRSRYLGFCDFDDVVYSGGYGYLLHRLQKTDAAAAFASSLHVDCTPLQGFDFVLSKRFLPGKDRYDFFLENFCPPNSVLLDRTRIDLQDLRADPALTRHEDYRVFAVIVAKYRTDWASVGTAVAEYVQRTDGSNTVLSYRSDAASWRDWGTTSEGTRRFFETLTTEVPVNDLVHMRDAERRLEAAEAARARMEQSLSWRLTRPLRSTIVRRLRHWLAGLASFRSE
jgi:GT2 family glycosyltransferase